MATSSILKRCTFTIAVVVIAGCGAVQSQNVTPSAISSEATVAGLVKPAASWMLPEAKRDRLLYVSSSYATVAVFSYPRGKQVGTLMGFGGSDSQVGLCADRNGNVWIPDYTDTVREYAHGGSTPIAIVRDPKVNVEDCSVDPTTGNLAVVGNINYGQAGSIAVYSGARGSPHTYDVSFPLPQFCAYDNNGNLFVDGMGPNRMPQFEFGQLAKGAKLFHELSLKSSISYAGPMGWDGKYLVIADGLKDAFLRFHVRGKQIVNVDTLYFQTGNAGFWVQDRKIVVTGGSGGRSAIRLYRYPSGGDPIRVFTAEGSGYFSPTGVTVSLAPH